MQLPLKSKRLEAMRAWLYEHPKTTLAIVLFLFFFITLPAWFASVWQLFTDKPFFVWLAERAKTMEFSAYWITVPIGVLAFLFIVYLLWSGKRAVRADKSPKGDKLVVVAENQNPEHTSDQHIEEIADYQRKTLRRYVLVENCEINSSPLLEGKLYIEFTFSFTNYSMFYVSIPMAEGDVIKRSIRFKGDLLSREAKLVENKVKECPPYSRKSFKIRQWVSQDEATDISGTLKTSGNLFDFSEAEVYVSGGDKHPDVEVNKLDLTRGMQNAALENKIIQLEAELREEKAAQERLKEQHRNEMSAETHRVGVIRALNYARGATLIVQHQLEEGETVSRGTLIFLTTIISPVVEQNFSEPQVSKFFNERLKKIPSEPFAQRYWVDELFEALSRLLDEKGG